MGTGKDSDMKVPVMDNLMSDVGDGTSVAAAIAFYQPANMPVKGRQRKVIS